MPPSSTPRGLASEVLFEPSVSFTVLVERLGRLSDQRLRELCAALEIALA
jgi:hypothetical protein